MSDRLFRLVFGITLIVATYFKQQNIIVALVGLLIFEAVTNRIILKTLGRLFRGNFGPQDMQIQTPEPKFNFEAEQGLRLMMASALTLGIAYPEQVWFFPWVVGFALISAGLAGICPVYLLLKWARLK